MAQEEAPRLLGERGAPPLDSRKDKAQKSRLRSLLTLGLRSAPEEPKEKAGRKVKGREGLLSPVESPEGPELPHPRKKAQDKKAGRRRSETRETQSTREQETRVLEAGPPKKASTGHSEEAPQGPTRRGEQSRPFSGDAFLHSPHFLGQSAPAGSSGLSAWECGSWGYSGGPQISPSQPLDLG